MEWVEQALRRASIDGHNEIYNKCGVRVFNGMVFVKFDSVQRRDSAMRQSNVLRTGRGPKTLFMSPDLPVDERVPRSYLFGVKRLLADWQFKNARVDTSTRTLSVAGVPILKAISF